MVHPLPATDMLSRTLDVREDYARELFDIGHIGMLIKKRAEQGADWVQIRQNRPMQLQHTRAVAKLMTWLAKNGYRVDWQDVVPQEGDREASTYPELRIYWSSRLQAVTVPAAKWIADQTSAQ